MENNEQINCDDICIYDCIEGLIVKEIEQIVEDEDEKSKIAKEYIENYIKKDLLEYPNLARDYLIQGFILGYKERIKFEEKEMEDDCK